MKFLCHTSSSLFKPHVCFLDVQSYWLILNSIYVLLSLPARALLSLQCHCLKATFLYLEMIQTKNLKIVSKSQLWSKSQNQPKLYRPTPGQQGGLCRWQGCHSPCFKPMHRKKNKIIIWNSYFKVENLPSVALTDLACLFYCHSPCQGPQRSHEGWTGTWEKCYEHAFSL